MISMTFKHLLVKLLNSIDKKNDDEKFMKLNVQWEKG